MKNIRKIENYEDFKNVYKVFSEKPYEEKYTEEDYREIFSHYRDDGMLYGTYLNEECIGLIALTYGVKKDQPVDFGEENIIYLSDVAVKGAYRKKGLGTMLMTYGVMESLKGGFDRIYMRTLERGKSMSYEIASKLGFEEMPGISQMVETENIYGFIQNKKNIFLSLDLRTLSKDDLSKMMSISREEILNSTKGEER